MAFNRECRRHLGLQPLPGMLIQMTPFLSGYFVVTSVHWVDFYKQISRLVFRFPSLAKSGHLNRHAAMP